MIDTDIQDLRSMVQEAAAQNQTHLRLPVDLAARFGAEVEARAIEHDRLMEAVGAALVAIAKWQSGEIDASTAMQMICGAADAWTGGAS